MVLSARAARAAEPAAGLRSAARRLRRGRRGAPGAPHEHRLARRDGGCPRHHGCKHAATTIPHGTAWCSRLGVSRRWAHRVRRSTTSSARSCTSRCGGLAVAAAATAAHVTSSRLRRRPSRSRSSSTGRSGSRSTARTSSASAARMAARRGTVFAWIFYAFLVWALVLLVIGVRTVHGWTWARSVAGVAVTAAFAAGLALAVRCSTRSESSRRREQLELVLRHRIRVLRPGRRRPARPRRTSPARCGSRPRGSA